MICIMTMKARQKLLFIVQTRIVSYKNGLMTVDKRYTSVPANAITASLTSKFITPPSPGKRYSLDTEDDFRSGCRDVSHQQQFFSELLTRTITQYELLFKNTCPMSKYCISQRTAATQANFFCTIPFKLILHIQFNQVFRPITLLNRSK